MELKAGTKLKSAVCTTEAIVIRPPSQPGELLCGSAPMLAAGGTPPPHVEALAAVETGAALVGKRYVDAETDLELLCTKSGKGALSFAGRALELKQAKPLPSSD